MHGVVDLTIINLFFFIEIFTLLTTGYYEKGNLINTKEEILKRFK